jgi:hypothetical protein
LEPISVKQSPYGVALDTKKSWFLAIEAVRKVEEVDLYQFQPFTSGYLVARTKTVDDRIIDICLKSSVLHENGV